MMNRQRLLNGLLSIAFLIVYLEWGKENSMYLFRIEYDILFSGTGKWKSFIHPLIFAPFAGQVLLLFTLFQKNPNWRLSTFAILLMGLLVFFIFAIGLLTANGKIIVFSLPFVILTVLHFYLFIKHKKQPKP
jgi:hypothetical protein